MDLCTFVEVLGEEEPVTNIPTRLVEVAARALHEYDRLKQFDEPTWEQINEDDRDSYRKAMHLVLAIVFAEWKRDLAYRASALEAVLRDREAELLALKGPCSNRRCCLHYAHSGPCNTESARALTDSNKTEQP